jgi:Aspartic acid proteinase inhibitor
MNETFSCRLVPFLSACLSFAVAAHDSIPKGLPGGYAPAELNREVMAAADFAVTEESRRETMPLKLTSISHAEKQIVAGTNYRFLLTVERARTRRQAKVVVFRDLKSRYWLKSWEWL